MDYQEYLEAVVTGKYLRPNWRLGQTLFNTLDNIRPDIAEKVSGKDGVDPFYKDEHVCDFLAFVKKEWRMVGRLLILDLDTFAGYDADSMLASSYPWRLNVVVSLPSGDVTYRVQNMETGEVESFNDLARAILDFNMAQREGGERWINYQTNT